MRSFIGIKFFTFILTHFTERPEFMINEIEQIDKRAGVLKDRIVFDRMVSDKVGLATDMFFILLRIRCVDI